MSIQSIQIEVDDLADGQIEYLLAEHRQEMFKHSPAESVHALDLDALRSPDITFWSAYIDGQHAGCGALAELTPSHAEIKSMKTRTEFVRKGVAAALLDTMLEQARQRGYARLSLETGAMDAFKPARSLYQKVGFVECPPFAGYVKDPHSVCMTKALDQA